MIGIYFQVDGEPVPKQSTRFGSGHAYPDKRVQEWQNRVSWAAREAVLKTNGGFEMMTGDIQAQLTFHLPTRRKVDIDNLCKAVLDGCTGIIFNDDRQVVRLEAVKKYNSKLPCVMVHFVEA